jgi:hypothetical protein
MSRKARDALAKDVSRQLRVEMRWSVLTTKALICLFGHKGLWRRGVCLELDYRRTITFLHGVEHKKHKSSD